MTTTAAPNQSSSKVFILAVVAVIIAGIAGVAVLATGRDSAVNGEPIGQDVASGCRRRPTTRPWARSPPI